MKPLCFLIFFSTSIYCFAEPTDKTANYWTCSTYDATHTKWTSQSIYKKIALNMAYDTCKKQSQTPTTCKTSRSNCEQYIHGLNVTPIWKCTALDRDALAWKSDPYSNREDAAIAAEAFCKQKSPVPHTCSVNMITCLNMNEI